MMSATIFKPLPDLPTPPGTKLNGADVFTARSHRTIISYCNGSVALTTVNITADIAYNFIKPTDV